MIIGFLATFCILIGCSGAATTVIPTPHGVSQTLVAFQESRSATQQDPQTLAALKAQLDAANDVDVSAAAETKRIAYVLRWSMDVYAFAWAQEAGVAWQPQGGNRTPAQADTEAAGFQAAMGAKRLALPAQAWTSDFAAFEMGFLAAQATVKHPTEWDGERKGMLQGALDAAYIIAVNAGATDLNSALAALGKISGKLFAAENIAFDELAALTGE